jgi:hypothetical protein
MHNHFSSTPTTPPSPALFNLARNFSDCPLRENLQVELELQKNRKIQHNIFWEVVFSKFFPTLAGSYSQETNFFQVWLNKIIENIAAYNIENTDITGLFYSAAFNTKNEFAGEISIALQNPGIHQDVIIKLLEWIAKIGRVDIMEVMVRASPVLTTKVGQETIERLTLGVYGKQQEMFYFLFKLQGVEREVVDNVLAHINKPFEHGQTPLIYSIINHYFTFAKLLLQCGADISIRDNYGHGAQYYAADVKNTEILKLLFEIEKKDKENKPPSLNNSLSQPTFWATRAASMSTFESSDKKCEHMSDIVLTNNNDARMSSTSTQMKMRIIN